MVSVWEWFHCRKVKKTNFLSSRWKITSLQECFFKDVSTKPSHTEVVIYCSGLKCEHTQFTMVLPSWESGMWMPNKASYVSCCWLEWLMAWELGYSWHVYLHQRFFRSLSQSVVLGTQSCSWLTHQTPWLKVLFSWEPNIAIRLELT